MGYAFIMYSVDHEAFMHLSAGTEWAASALHAETKSLLKAVSLLKENILYSVSIVTDCKTLADSINKVSADISWTTENSMQAVKTILKDLPQARVNFIARKYNSAADFIAKEARVKKLQQMSTQLTQKVPKASILSNVFEKTDL